MKKTLSLFLAALFLISSIPAYADFTDINLIKYNVCASVCGAPELSPENARTSVQDGNVVTLFKSEKMLYGFVCDQSDHIVSVAVYAVDETCTADFICSCMAMIQLCSSDFDYSVYGSLLMQFSSIRKGNEAQIRKVGDDYFSMQSLDGYQYQFVYINKDKETK